jgi:hypothetical protein
VEPERLTVRCACGWESTGFEDDVVDATREHGERIHNMSANRDQILAMAIPAAASEKSTDSRRATPRT